MTENPMFSGSARPGGGATTKKATGRGGRGGTGKKATGRGGGGAPALTQAQKVRNTIFRKRTANMSAGQKAAARRRFNRDGTLPPAAKKRIPRKRG